MELIVVMTVTVLLTGLMLPALVRLRENAHRVVCSSNQRQIGLATVMYADDHNGTLPPSEYGKPHGAKQEMMAAHRGHDPSWWEGFGWLFHDLYAKDPRVFYCPSHTGLHPFEQYEQDWLQPTTDKIFTNYHYAGPIDWEEGTRRLLHQPENILLATDGLRTIRDFNHRTGFNVLRGDISVTWRDDVDGEIADLLPDTEPPDEAAATDDDERYSDIWDAIDGAY